MALKGCVNGCLFGLLILLLSVFVSPGKSYSQNLPPVINLGIPNQHAEVGSLFRYTLPSNAFKDENFDPLSVTIYGLPAWLSYDPQYQEFSGTPSSVGTHAISVTVSDPSGLEANTPFSITVHPSGTTYAAFTMNTARGCDYQLVYFTNLSKGGTKFHWTFGNDNESFDEATNSAIYNKPGKYTVTLTINGGGSPELTHTEIITIYSKPEVDIIAEPSGGCEPLDVALSTSNEGASYYNWFFFDKLPAQTTFEPTLQLTNLPGNNYNGGLKITDGNGCQNQKYYIPLIKVNSAPLPAFSYEKDDPCKPSRVVFTNKSIAQGSPILRNEWYIDGALMGTTKNFSHVFTQPGDYVVELICESDQNCRSQAYADTIHFNSGNRVAFSVENLCFGDSTLFIPDVSPTFTGYSWDFDGDGTIDDQSEKPYFQYQNEDTYTARLTASFSDGCSLEASKPVTIEKVNANFTQEFITQCPPDYAIRFTDQSTSSTGAPVISRNWFLVQQGQEDLLISTAPEFTHRFRPGNYTIRLEVETATCIGKIEVPVDLSDPQITIEVSGKTRGCVDGSATHLSVDFRGLNDPASSYEWNFGDGQTGSGQSVSHIYSAPGTYSAQVQITTQNGCTFIRSREAAVQLATPPTVSKLEVIRDNQCYNTLSSLHTEFSPGTDSLRYILPDPTGTIGIRASGTSSEYSYQFPDPGTFEITVSASEKGCSSEPFHLYNIVVLGPKASFTFSASDFCNGPTTVTFVNQSIAEPGTQYTWDFGDGSDPEVNNDLQVVHLFESTGSYSVSLLAEGTNNCSHTYVGEVKLFSFDNTPGIIQASITEGCAPLSVTFSQNIRERLSENYVVSEYLWDFNHDGTIDSREETPTNSYLQPGNYSVKLEVIGNNGCDYEFSVDNFINAVGPVSSFTYAPQPVCNGGEVTFSNTTQNQGSNANQNQYSWDFGDGTTITLPHPVHTFVKDSIYTVKLTASDASGCSNTDSMKIQIEPLKAQFALTRDTVCQGTEITLQNQSSGNIIRYRWDFNGDKVPDLETPSATDPTWTYPTRGVYPVSLEVVSTSGCTQTFTQEIRVTQSTANFSALETDIGCAPAFAYFQAEVNDEDVQDYIWVFGDGNTSKERNPRNFYSSPGYFTVSLTVVFKGGCSHTTTKTDYIFADGAYGEFGYDKTVGCAPNPVLFTVSNMRKVESITWDYGDGNTQNDPVPEGVQFLQTEYNYTLSGKQTPFVLLSHPVCGTYAYENTQLGPIYTSTPPIAGFTSNYNKICEGIPVRFTDTSQTTDPNFEVTQWKWLFPDNTIITGVKNPSYAFKSQAWYSVSLIVTSGAGCSDTVTVTDGWRVYGKANLDASFDLGDSLVCPGQEIRFTSTATSLNGPITNLQWKFGDGTSAGNLSTTTHSYSDAFKGNPLNSWLIATDDKLCTDSTYRTVNINNLQAALEYRPQPVFRGGLVTFNSLSTTDFGTKINSYQWNFPFGNPEAPGNLPQVSTVYHNMQNAVPATLTVTNDNGCTASVTETFNVLNNPPAVTDFAIMFLTSTTFTFRLEDFEQHYSDNDSAYQSMISIKIETLPLNAILKLNGVPVSAGQVINSSDIPQLTIEAEPNYTGTTQFLWHGNDGIDQSLLPATVTVTIAPYPEAAILDDIFININKDSTITFPKSLFNDHFTTEGIWSWLRITRLTVTELPDAGKGRLYLNGVTVTAPLEIDSLSLEQGSGLQFVPAPGYGGEAVIRWTASDDYNPGANTARVVINYLNRKPVLTDIIRIDLKEDKVQTFQQQEFREHFSDPDQYDQPLTFVLRNLPASSEGIWRVNGNTVSEFTSTIPFVNGLNHVTFTPAKGFEGITIADWIVSDGMDTDTARIELTFKNTPPIVHSVDKNGTEDTEMPFKPADFSSKISVGGPFEDEDEYDALTKIQVLSLPENGTLTFRGNPIDAPRDFHLNEIQFIRFKPDTDWNGKTWFLYNGFDGSDWALIPDTVFLYIAPVNDPPVARDTTFYIDEDQKLAGVSVRDNDFDIDNTYDELTLSLVDEGTAGQNGTIDLSSYGTLVFTPNQDFHGKVQFKYKLCDPEPLCREAIVTIVLAPVNDKPVAQDDLFEITEKDKESTFESILNNDSDVDEEEFFVLYVQNDTVTTIQGVYGTLHWGADGTTSYQLNNGIDTLKQDELVEDVFDYMISDSSEATAAAIITIRIQGRNDPPVAENDSCFTNQNDAITLYPNEGMLSNDYDIDGDAFEMYQVNGSPYNPYAASNGEMGYLKWKLNGEFEYTPDERAIHLALGDTLTDTFVYTLQDENEAISNTATLIIYVGGLNDKPVAITDSLTFYENRKPVSIAYNQKPALLYNDNDPDDHYTINVKEINGDTLGMATGLTGTLQWNTDGGYTYFPGDSVFTLAQDSLIYDYFWYIVSDEHGATDTATLVLTIIGINDPPFANNDTLSILEDQHITERSESEGLLSNDDDPDKDKLIASINDQDQGIAFGRYGILKWDSTGAYTYTTYNEVVDSLNRSMLVQDVFTYKVTDPYHVEGEAKLTILIQGQNDPPVLRDKREALTENDPQLVKNSRETGMLRGDYDIDGDEFGIIKVNQQETETIDGKYGRLTWKWDGTFVYSTYEWIHQLKENQIVTDTFCYVVRDQFPMGGYEGQDSTAFACHFFDITGINDAPVALNDTIRVKEDNIALLEYFKEEERLLYNDKDVEYDPFGVIQLHNSTTSPVEGQFATIGWDELGKLIYQRAMDKNLDTLPLGAFAHDSMHYVIADQPYGSQAEAWLHLVLIGENDAPVAFPDQNTIYEDQQSIQSIPGQGLLDNDKDIDRGDTLFLVSVNWVSSGFSYKGNYGTIEWGSDGSYKYRIILGYETTDTLAQGEQVFDKFPYQIRDQHNTTDTDTLTITVVGVNDDPIAREINLIISEETESIDSTVLLSVNDVDRDPLLLIEINGDTLKTVTGKYGRLKWLSNGTITYLPDIAAVDSLKHGRQISDEFTYTVSDPHGATASASIKITIEGENDPPLARNVFHSIMEKTETLAIGASDSLSLLNPNYAYDVDGDTLEVSLMNQSNEVMVKGKYGNLTWARDGSYTFVNNLDSTARLAYGDTAVQAFTFTLADIPYGASNSAQLLFEIIGVNDPPVANPVYYETIEYNAIEETVEGGEHITYNDYDVDSEEFFITSLVEQIGKSASISTLNKENSFGARANLASSTTGNYGEIFWNPDGSFIYYPDTLISRALKENERLEEVFEYTITDDWDSTATSTIYISIIGKNNAPVAYSDTIYVKDSRTPVVKNAPGILIHTFDYDTNDTLQITQIDGTTNQTLKRDFGTLNWDSTGQVVFTPDFETVEKLGPNQRSQENFEFTVSDILGATSKAQLYVIIVGMNSPLSALDTTVSIDEDSYLLLTPKTYDLDNSGMGNIDTTSIRIIGKPKHGTASANTSSMEIFYRPEKDFTGSDSLQYYLCDTGGSCDDGWIYINVLEVNDPPFGIDTVLNVLVGETVSFDPFSRAFDTDDGIDRESLKIIKSPALGNADFKNDSIFYTATNTPENFDELVYQLNDISGETVYIIVSINILHKSTLFAQNDRVETVEDTPVSFKVLRNDTLNGYVPYPLSFNIKVHPRHGYINVNPADTSLLYTPYKNYFGPDKLVYTICTAEGICDQAEVHLSITPLNDPIIANDDAVFTLMGNPVEIDILDNDFDPDGKPDPNSVQLGKAQNGTATYNLLTGKVLYKHNLNFKGTDTFTYTVCDNDPVEPTCDEAQVTVLVGFLPFNIFAVNDGYSMKMNEQLELDHPHPLDNDYVINGAINSASFAVTHLPSRGEYNPTDNRYQPNEGYWGTDLMRYMVCDTDTSCDMADINLWISPANLPPVANNDYFAIIENRPNRLLVLGNDYDPDGYLLNSSLTVIQNPVNGLVSIDPQTGSLLYEPAINKGFDSLIYRICDNGNECTEASVKIEIDLGRNLVEKRITPEDTPDTLNLPKILATLNLYAAISGIDTLIAPENGTIELGENGNRLIYFPDPDYHGPDYFKLKLISAEVPNILLTVYMTVTPVNDAPVALNDTVTWNEPNNETRISFSDLLNNDYDVDGDTIHLKRNYIERGFESLSIAFNADSTITLKADSIEWCSAWFTYRIDDPSSLYDIGKVLIFPVLDRNNLITNKDRFDVDENSKNNMLDVLANDSIIDKQRCTIDTIYIIYPPKHAMAAPTNDFMISYTPEAHYYTRPNEQPDSLMYRAINIWGQSDSAWVYINIVQKNTPPVANNDLVTPEFGKETAIDVLANDKDPDPDGFIVPSLTTYTQPDYGTLRYDTARGLFTYIPLIETCESDSFRYTIFDNEGGSDQALVTIQSPAEAPVTAVSDTVRTYPGIKVEAEPLLNDLGYFTPTIGTYNNPSNGTVTLGTDNTVAYQPEASFVGRDSMAYTITTPCGNSSSAYIVFLVEELRVPEIITPNDDTKNDVLIIDGIEYYPESILEIYNRYGHIVYSMRGYNNSWGGFSNKGSLGGDKPLPAATYYYVLKYNQGRNRQAGFIYLFR